MADLSRESSGIWRRCMGNQSCRSRWNGHWKHLLSIFLPFWTPCYHVVAAWSSLQRLPKGKLLSHKPAKHVEKNPRRHIVCIVFGLCKLLVELKANLLCLGNECSCNVFDALLWVESHTGDYCKFAAAKFDTSSKSTENRICGEAGNCPANELVLPVYSALIEHRDQEHQNIVRVKLWCLGSVHSESSIGNGTRNFTW